MSQLLAEDRDPPAAPFVAHPRIVRGIYGVTDRGLTGFFMNGVPALFEPPRNEHDRKAGRFVLYTTVSHTIDTLYGQPPSRKDDVADREALFVALEDQLGLAPDSLAAKLDEQVLGQRAHLDGAVSRTMVRIYNKLEPLSDDLARAQSVGWGYVSFDASEKGA